MNTQLKWHQYEGIDWILTAQTAFGEYFIQRATLPPRSRVIWYAGLETPTGETLWDEPMCSSNMEALLYCQRHYDEQIGNLLREIEYP